MEWISTKERLPEMDIDVQIKYGENDKEEFYGKYTESRVCMMAGIAGAHGYFGEGWAVADFEEVDSNLIIDEPSHWKPIKVEPNE